MKIIVKEFNSDQEMYQFINNELKRDALKKDLIEKYGKHTAELNLIDRCIEITLIEEK